MSDFIQCSECHLVIRDNTEDTHCDCGASIDENCFPLNCSTCHEPLHLADGMEWPEQQKLYCWGCAHEALVELADLKAENERLRRELT